MTTTPEIAPTPLVFDGVTKLYGPVIGVNNISCRVAPGVTGLFGANGAGKTTLIKLASGQLRPSAGTVRVGAHDAWSTAAKRLFGYCPDLNNFYEDMTGREFVTFMARLSGLSTREARARADEAIATVGMSDRALRRMAGGSHGMRQRIKLAQALVHDPPLMLLDEPFTGIDPGGRHEMHTLLGRLAERGKTILVSTHILAEVEDLVDSIVLIARGRVLATGSLGEIRNLLDDRPFTVAVGCDRPRELAAALMTAAEVYSIELARDGMTVRTAQPTRFFARVGQLAAEHGHDIHRLETLDAGAEAVFDYLTGAK